MNGPIFSFSENDTKLAVTWMRNRVHEKKKLTDILTYFSLLSLNNFFCDTQFE